MTAPPRKASSAADAYELAACGLLTLAVGGAIELANPTFCTWTGYALEELVGKKRFQDLLTVGSKLFHQTHWMPLLQLQGSVAEVQLELVHRDGRVFAVLVNAARRDVSASSHVGATAGSIDVAVFVATDRRNYERELVLARRRAEELLASERAAREAQASAEAGLRLRENQFRTLAENSPDIIARFDVSHRFLYVSPAGVRLTGKPIEALLGRAVDEIGMHSALATAWSTALGEAFSGHAATLGFAHHASDGSAPRELQAHIVPERDAAGEIVSALAITRDITLLKQQERESAQRALLAEQLIGIVSHDLRNPLNAVLLGAQLLESGKLSEVDRRLVARITSSAHRANRLIADLLDFTQARLGGGIRITLREIDLHALIAECVDELKLAWPGRVIEHVQEGQGICLGDPDRLAQVVSNLSNNALTYGTPSEPVTVTSVVGVATVEIRVHNVGRPIPDELRPHIFDALRRGDSQVQLGSRSVGLGLYIVHEIAKAHQGRVTLQSTETEGTTFVVTQPRNPPQTGTF